MSQTTQVFGKMAADRRVATRGPEPWRSRNRRHRAAQPATIVAVEPVIIKEPEEVFVSLDAVTSNLRRRVTTVSAAPSLPHVSPRPLAAGTVWPRRPTGVARATVRRLIVTFALPVLSGVSLLLWLAGLS
jgi:hypothetical protein